MAPIIEISKKTLKTLKPEVYTLRKDLGTKSSNKRDLSNFIYVPSINIYVAKQRTLHTKNWFECHKELQQNNERMLIIPEFIEFLKYLKTSNNQEYLEIYKDIIEVKYSWRAEWLDADFKVKDKKLHINSNHVFDSNKCLIPKNSEILDKNTLMKDKTTGISLEDWLINPARQGLPTKKTKSEDLYYRCPRSDNNSVAGFFALSDWVGLSCNRFPSGMSSILGVRAVRHE